VKNPDVILVGILRDSNDSVGDHGRRNRVILVFATLHTSSAPRRWNRMVDVVSLPTSRPSTGPAQRQPRGIFAQTSACAATPVAMRSAAVMAQEIDGQHTGCVANLIRGRQRSSDLSQLQTGGPVRHADPGVSPRRVGAEVPISFDEARSRFTMATTELQPP